MNMCIRLHCTMEYILTQTLLCKLSQTCKLGTKSKVCKLQEYMIKEIFLCAENLLNVLIKDVYPVPARHRICVPYTSLLLKSSYA